MKNIFTFLFICFHTSFCLAENSYKINTSHVFIENKGQIVNQDNLSNSAVKYLYNSDGLNVQLRQTGFSYDLYKSTFIEQEVEGLKPNKKEKQIIETKHFHRIDIEWLGANKNCEIIATEKQQAYLNFPSKEIYQIGQYGNVLYKNIYPNIDLEFTTNASLEKSVKYNFIIHEGGDIEKIRWKYWGDNGVDIKNGNITLQTSHGALEENIPYSFYQETKQEVAINYLQHNDGSFSFQTNKKALAKGTLVIDPIPAISWGTYFGGSSSDELNKISYNSVKGIYIGGSTTSTSNVATSGSFLTTYQGSKDALVARFSSNGNLIWASYYGGALRDEGLSVIGDVYGNVYLTGLTESDAGISTPGTYKPTYVFNGYLDAYLVKFDSSGVRKWGTYFGGSVDDQGVCLGLSPNNNYIYMGGATKSSSGIATASSYQTTFGGGTNYDGYYAEFTSTGSLQYATYYGGSGWDYVYDIDVDPSWYVYLAGYTSSATNIASSGAYQTSLNGTGTGTNGDAFLARFSSIYQRQWCTYFGGTSDEGTGLISSDGGTSLYLAGSKPSTGLATSGAYMSYGQGYLTKFNTSGQRQWTTYVPGAVNDISSDGGSLVYLTGNTATSVNVATFDAYQKILGSSQDCFLSCFNSNGGYNLGTYYGGNGIDDGKSLTCGVVNNEVYITGNTTSSNAIATPGAFQTSNGGFLVKFSTCGASVEVKDTVISICEGAPLTIATDTSATILSYQWQVNTGSGFVNLTNDTIYSNVTKSTLVFSKAKLSFNNYLYRCVASGYCGIKDTSSSSKLKIISTPYITGGNLANDTIKACTNGGVSLFVNSPISGGNFQWQVNTGSGFNNISTGGIYTGATTKTLSINPISSVNNYTYRCIAGSQCYVKDTSATKFVQIKNAPVINGTIGSRTNLCPGTSVTLTGAATGDSLVFSWKAGTTVLTLDTFPFSGVKTNSLTIASVTTSNTVFTLVATNSCGSTTATATVGVTTLAAPHFSTSPASQTVFSGSTVAFSGSLTPQTTYYYQWQVDTGGGFQNVVIGSLYSNNNSIYGSTLNLSTTTVAMNGYKYRCVVRDSCSRYDTSAVGVLTVLDASTIITSQTPSFSTCSNQTVTYFVTVSPTCAVPKYVWQTNYGSGYSTGSGTTSSISDYAACGGMVRCIVSCGTAKDTSTPIVVNCYAPVSIAQQPQNITVCPGSPLTYTFTVSGGYNNQFRWYDGGLGPYIDGTNGYGETISGAATRTLTIVNHKPNGGGGYCKIQDGCTGTIISTNWVYFDTFAIPTVTLQLPSAAICDNGDPITLSGGSPAGGVYRLNGSTITTFDPIQKGDGVYPIVYRYTTSDNCEASATENLTVGASFSPPTITQNGNTLNSDAGTGNQWYKNGVALSGETDATLIIQGSGNYYTVVSVDGCSATSNTIGIVNGIKPIEAESNAINLYPNPASDKLFIETQNKEIEQFSIYNVTGALVLSIKQPAKSGVDINFLSSGVYTTEIKMKNSSVKKKFVKL